MPEPINPNPQNNVDGATSGGQQQTPPVALSKFNELKQKKGFKSEDDLAASYEEVEKTKSRFENIHGKIKQQIEAVGYTIDDEGNIKQTGDINSSPARPAENHSSSQPVTEEPIYDPYTGQVITDPISLQLARMPVGHREAFIVNAMLDQREKQQAAAYQADVEILAKPEAKGFEDDVRKVMQALPLARRANKQEWQDALLRVKGMRYEQDKQKWGQQGVEQFINREEIQTPTGTGHNSGSSGLTPDQESTYQWYKQNQPGLFKDRAHFARALSPTGGR